MLLNPFDHNHNPLAAQHTILELIIQHNPVIAHTLAHFIRHTQHFTNLVNEPGDFGMLGEDGCTHRAGQHYCIAKYICIDLFARPTHDPDLSQLNYAAVVITWTFTPNRARNSDSTDHDSGKPGESPAPR